MERQKMCLEFILKGTVKANGSGIFRGMKKKSPGENPFPWALPNKTPQDEKEEIHSEEHIAKEHSSCVGFYFKPKRLLAENLAL